MLCIQKCAISRMSLHIAAFDISQGQNWCCVFRKVQCRPVSLHIAASAISQGHSRCSIVKWCSIMMMHIIIIIMKQT